MAGLTVIVLFEVAGDFLQQAVGAPVPGPVNGMALLLAALIIKGRLPVALDRASTGILAYLPVLFVPAGVGVMAHVDLIRAQWPSIVAAVAVSSLLTIVVTAAVMLGVERAATAIRQRPSTPEAANVAGSK